MSDNDTMKLSWLRGFSQIVITIPLREGKFLFNGVLYPIITASRFNVIDEYMEFVTHKDENGILFPRVVDIAHHRILDGHEFRSVFTGFQKIFTRDNLEYLYASWFERIDPNGYLLLYVRPEKIRNSFADHASNWAFKSSEYVDHADIIRESTFQTKAGE